MHLYIICFRRRVHVGASSLNIHFIWIFKRLKNLGFSDLLKSKLIFLLKSLCIHFGKFNQIFERYTLIFTWIYIKSIEVFDGRYCCTTIRYSLLIIPTRVHLNLEFCKKLKSPFPKHALRVL